MSIYPLVERHATLDAWVLTPRGSLKIVPADVLVIDKATLPEVRTDPDDGNWYASAEVGGRLGGAHAPMPVVGLPCNSQCADWHRASALAHLALAERLDAHPPVDMEQYADLVTLICDNAGDALTGSDIDTLARRLLATGRLTVQP